MALSIIDKIASKHVQLCLHSLASKFVAASMRVVVAKHNVLPRARLNKHLLHSHWTNAGLGITFIIGLIIGLMLIAYIRLKLQMLLIYSESKTM